MRRTGVLIALLALAATACGSSGGSKAAPPTTTSTKPSTDQRVIAAGRLRLTDLPPGYLSTLSDSGRNRAIRSTPGCDQFPVLLGQASDESRAFIGDGSIVGSQITTFKNENLSRNRFDELHIPSIISCLHDSRVKQYHDARETTLTGLDVSPLATDPIGDDAAGFRFTTRTGNNGTTTNTLQDIVIVRVGRAIVTLRAGARTSGKLAEIETTLLPKLVDRMKHAGA